MSCTTNPAYPRCSRWRIRGDSAIICRLHCSGKAVRAPTFAEPVGGATQSCYTIESARARTLNEGALVMALAGPAIGYFRSGSLSRLVKKVTGEGIEDSPIYGAGVLLPPGTVLRVQFDADNTGDLILPSGYSVCGDVSGGSLVVGGALGARSVPVRLRTEALAEVLSGGGEPDAGGSGRAGRGRARRRSPAISASSPSIRSTISSRKISTASIRFTASSSSMSRVGRGCRARHSGFSRAGRILLSLPTPSFAGRR